MSEQASKKWFGSHNRVESTSIHYLLEKIKSGAIKLPGFQRGAAWKPEQITMLWDSISKNYPIGSLMLFDGFQSGKNNIETRGLTKVSEISKDPEELWLILDGQQRCNAIALVLGVQAQQSPLESRIWIDLNPKNLKGNEKDAKPTFHLTTIAQPWGVGSREVKRSKREIN